MTNALLDAGVLVVLALACGRVLARLRAVPLLVTVLVLGVLTAVFDTLMIRAGLYVFDPRKILGVKIWGAPLEDFAYAVAAALGVPVLWTVLRRLDPATHGAAGGASAGASAAPAEPSVGPPAEPSVTPPGESP